MRTESKTRFTKNKGAEEENNGIKVKKQRERERERERKSRIKRKRKICIFVQRVRSHVQCSHASSTITPGSKPVNHLYLRTARSASQIPIRLDKWRFKEPRDVSIVVNLAGARIDTSRRTDETHFSWPLL